MDSYGANAAFAETVFAPHPISDGRFSWSPDASVGWIDGRDVRRYRDAGYGAAAAVVLFAAGARFRASDDHWYRLLFISFQLAGANHVTQALSSHYPFISTLGLAGPAPQPPAAPCIQWQPARTEPRRDHGVAGSRPGPLKRHLPLPDSGVTRDRRPGRWPTAA